MRSLEAVILALPEHFLGSWGYIIVLLAAILEVLPFIGSFIPGQTIVILAGFFAAIMSSADTVLLITSMTLVHDLYIKSLGKRISPKKILSVSRWTTFFLGIIALIISLVVFNIVHLTIEAVSFSVALLPAIIFGFYWKKANEKAAFWSILLGTLAIIVFLFISPVQAFIPGIIVSFITFFIVQFLTSKK